MGIAVGSGVIVDSPGVVTVEAPALRTLPFPKTSLSNLEVTAFICLAVGRVPSGAMFKTTPCRSIPASAKLGRGGGKGGSTHLSMNVLGLSDLSDLAAFEFRDDFAAFAGAPT